MSKNKMWKIGGWIALGVVWAIVIWNLIFLRREKWMRSLDL